ncbi:hypothetical protein ACFL3D_00555 [Candidatus Omnitrophota bacterium]
MGIYVRKRFHYDGQSTFFIVVLLLLFVSSVGVCAYFYFAKEHMVQLHFEKVDTLNKKIITLSEYIKEKDIANKDLKNSLTIAERTLTDYKNKNKEAMDLVKQLSEIKTMLNQQFLQVNDSLAAGFSKIDTFSLAFDSKIKDQLSKNKKELTTFLKEEKASGAVELPKLVVKAEKSVSNNTAPQVTKQDPDVKHGKINPTITPPALQDENKKVIKVMKVNQKHGFFVINKGMIDGVKVGSPIEIYRHDVKIADALISEVRELVSLGKIEKQHEGHFIEEGDSVNFK